MAGPLEQTVSKIERNRFKISEETPDSKRKSTIRRRLSKMSFEEEDSIGAKSFIKKKKQNYLKKIFDIEL